MRPIEIHCCAKEKSIMSFPMGALCIKTEINHAEGLPKAGLHEHFCHEDPVRAAKEAAKRRPWAIGLSVYIWNSEWMRLFAVTVRKMDPGIMIFAGGPHTTAYTVSLPEWLDFAVLGEGELSTVGALSSIVSGKRPDNLQLDGIITRNYVSPVSSRLPELSKLHSPFLTGEASEVLKNYDSVLWELTRGCPFACAFCFESRGKRTVRDYPLDRIEKELDYLIKNHVENVFVLDPTFNLNPERAKTILRLLLKKAPQEMHFTFEIRAELVDEELADMFAELNCSLQIGLQSCDEEVLKTIGRKFDKDLFTEKTRLLASRGAAFGLDIIIGLPKDNLKRFRNTVNYAVSLMPSNIDCFLLSLLPGTELAMRAKEYGLIPGQDVERTILSTPSFTEKDISIALSVRRGMDLFYTKGQSCMWIHCILEALNITACNLFSLFVKWMDQTGRSEEEDIWVLQDDFVQSLFEKTQNAKLLPAMKSFMELHQGICYVTDTCEPAQVDLSYRPEDLALLDEMSLAEFVKSKKMHRCSPTIVMEGSEIKFY
ncbi:MAG: radical SAM protein [Spirochaetales bacterium]|nr:radical SAM protein [Spirochaetales bacterium]